MPSYKEVEAITRRIDENNVDIMMKIGKYIVQLQNEVGELNKRVRALEEKPPP